MADHRGHTTTHTEDMAERPDSVGVTTRPVDDRAPLQATETRTSRRPAAEVGYGSDADHTADVKISEASNLARDRVRWGPILAGLCTALTSLLLLGLLGLALGLTVVNAGTAAAQGAPPDDAGRTTAIWGAVSALISFFLGGYVAGKTAAVFDRGWGALNGALVFLVAVPVTLWLASMGLGTVMGTLGSFAGSLNADPGTAQTAAQGAADQARQAAQNVQPVDVARAAERVRNAAWGTLLGAVLGLGASALGGMLGTRRELQVSRATGRVSE
jgi:hypothetical protein